MDSSKLLLFSLIMFSPSLATPFQRDWERLLREDSALSVDPDTPSPAAKPRLSKVQLFNLPEIVDALSQAHPVSLYVDLPMCWQSETRGDPSSMLNLRDEFPFGAFSINIDQFQYLGQASWLYFGDSTVVKTRRGDLYQLRFGGITPYFVFAYATWLDPVKYNPIHQILFQCQLQNSTVGSSGNVKATSSKVSLQRVDNFNQLKAAIEGGYDFRFYIRYSNCSGGPGKNISTGGIIEGMRLSTDGSYATFSKTRMAMTERPPITYVTDILVVTIYQAGFYAEVVTSVNRLTTFQPLSNTTCSCPISSSSARKAFELYMF